MRQKKPIIIGVLISIIAYIALAYVLPRTQFVALLGLFAVLFSIYWWQAKHLTTKEMWSVAILYRLLIVCAIPSLSDDFYRFVWDGQLTAIGIHPFAYTPTEIQPLHLPRFDVSHYSQLNSTNYYTVYPFVCQVIMYLSAVLSFHSFWANVVVMKLIFVLADIGSIYFLQKILQKLNKPIHYLGLYALNPLVVMEFCGNLHFECMMLFFVLWAIWAMLQQDTSRRIHPTRDCHRFPGGIGLLRAISPILLSPVFCN